MSRQLLMPFLLAAILQVSESVGQPDEKKPPTGPQLVALVETSLKDLEEFKGVVIKSATIAPGDKVEIVKLTGTMPNETLRPKLKTLAETVLKNAVKEKIIIGGPYVVDLKDVLAPGVLSILRESLKDDPELKDVAIQDAKVTGNDVKLTGSLPNEALRPVVKTKAETVLKNAVNDKKLDGGPYAVDVSALLAPMKGNVLAILSKSLKDDAETKDVVMQDAKVMGNDVKLMGTLPNEVLRPIVKIKGETALKNAVANKDLDGGPYVLDVTALTVPVKGNVLAILQKSLQDDEKTKEVILQNAPVNDKTVKVKGILPNEGLRATVKTNGETALKSAVDTGVLAGGPFVVDTSEMTVPSVLEILRENFKSDVELKGVDLKEAAVADKSVKLTGAIPNEALRPTVKTKGEGALTKAVADKKLTGGPYTIDPSGLTVPKGNVLEILQKSFKDDIELKDVELKDAKVTGNDVKLMGTLPNEALRPIVKIKGETALKNAVANKDLDGGPYVIDAAAMTVPTKASVLTVLREGFKSDVELKDVVVQDAKATDNDVKLTGTIPNEALRPQVKTKGEGFLKKAVEDKKLDGGPYVVDAAAMTVPTKGNVLEILRASLKDDVELKGTVIADAKVTGNDVKLTGTIPNEALRPVVKTKGETALKNAVNDKKLDGGPYVIDAAAMTVPMKGNVLEILQKSFKDDIELKDVELKDAKVTGNDVKLMGTLPNEALRPIVKIKGETALKNAVANKDLDGGPYVIDAAAMTVPTKASVLTVLREGFKSDVELKDVVVQDAKATDNDVKLTGTIPNEALRPQVKTKGEGFLKKAVEDKKLDGGPYVVDAAAMTVPTKGNVLEILRASLKDDVELKGTVIADAKVTGNDVKLTGTIPNEALRPVVKTKGETALKNAVNDKKLDGGPYVIDAAAMTVPMKGNVLEILQKSFKDDIELKDVELKDAKVTGNDVKLMGTLPNEALRPIVKIKGETALKNAVANKDLDGGPYVIDAAAMTVPTKASVLTVLREGFKSDVELKDVVVQDAKATDNDVKLTGTIPNEALRPQVKTKGEGFLKKAVEDKKLDGGPYVVDAAAMTVPTKGNVLEILRASLKDDVELKGTVIADAKVTGNDVKLTGTIPNEALRPILKSKGETALKNAVQQKILEGGPYVLDVTAMVAPTKLMVLEILRASFKDDAELKDVVLQAALIKENDVKLTGGLPSEALRAVVKAKGETVLKSAVMQKVLDGGPYVIDASAMTSPAQPDKTKILEILRSSIRDVPDLASVEFTDLTLRPNFLVETKGFVPSESIKPQLKTHCETALKNAVDTKALLGGPHTVDVTRMVDRSVPVEQRLNVVLAQLFGPGKPVDGRLTQAVVRPDGAVRLTGYIRAEAQRAVAEREVFRRLQEAVLAQELPGPYSRVDAARLKLFPSVLFELLQAALEGKPGTDLAGFRLFAADLDAAGIVTLGGLAISEEQRDLAKKVATQTVQKAIADGKLGMATFERMDLTRVLIGTSAVTELLAIELYLPSRVQRIARALYYNPEAGEIHLAGLVESQEIKNRLSVDLLRLAPIYQVDVSQVLVLQAGGIRPGEPTGTLVDAYDALAGCVASRVVEMATAVIRNNVGNPIATQQAWYIRAAGLVGQGRRAEALGALRVARANAANLISGDDLYERTLERVQGSWRRVLTDLRRAGPHAVVQGVP